MGEITYQPLRSLIYVDCVKEEYRHKLQHWLYYYHAPESIAKFEPWVTKYAFYNALPTPPQGERFGTYRMQLTEHYWMVNPMSQESLVNSLNEYFPIDAMIWQGTLTENAKEEGFMADGEAAVLPVVITDARRLFLHFYQFSGNRISKVQVVPWWMGQTIVGSFWFLIRKDTRKMVISG